MVVGLCVVLVLWIVECFVFFGVGIVVGDVCLMLVSGLFGRLLIWLVS